MTHTINTSLIVLVLEGLTPMVLQCGEKGTWMTRQYVCYSCEVLCIAVSGKMVSKIYISVSKFYLLSL
jgi:hypothetical protein